MMRDKEISEASVIPGAYSVIPSAYSVIPSEARDLTLVQKLIFLMSIILSTLFSQNLYAATNFKPLPVDEALAFSAMFIRPNVVQVQWQVAPGYLLYAKKIHINFSPDLNSSFRLPTGKFKQDPAFGRVEVLKGLVSVPIALQTNVEQTTMIVEYQGCAVAGFCYPPMHKSVALNLAALTATIASDVANTVTPYYTLKSLLTDQNGVKDLLQTLPMGWMVAFFLGLGLLLAFTPCVLPMIPILTSIIVGQEHLPGTKKAFLFSLCYVLGMALTYAILGLAAASLGGSIQAWLQKPVTIAVVSGLLVLLALSLFGLYEFRFSRRWQNWVAAWSDKHEGGTFVGVFLMGVLSTLVVSPCVTAPLVGVLIYIGQTGNLFLGAGALFTMGLGMGIPLLLIGTSAGKWLPKSGAWMKAVKELFGLFMVGMAIWLLSRIIPLTATFILFGLLFIGTGAFVGLYLPRLIRLNKMNQTLGLVSSLLGVFLIWTGMTGAMTEAVVGYQNISNFTVVNNQDDLDQQLALAKEKKRPVLLDFYADWCQSCLSMDNNVFSIGNVRQALGNFILLRVNVTNNTAADAELLKRFDVIAPPTVLFFNPTGKEVDSQRIVGELDANEFLLRVDKFKHAACDSQMAKC